MSKKRKRDEKNIIDLINEKLDNEYENAKKVFENQLKKHKNSKKTTNTYKQAYSSDSSSEDEVEKTIIKKKKKKLPVEKRKIKEIVIEKKSNKKKKVEEEEIIIEKKPIKKKVEKEVVSSSDSELFSLSSEDTETDSEDDDIEIKEVTSEDLPVQKKIKKVKNVQESDVTDYSEDEEKLEEDLKKVEKIDEVLEIVKSNGINVTVGKVKGIKSKKTAPIAVVKEKEPVKEKKTDSIQDKEEELKEKVQSIIEKQNQLINKESLQKIKKREQNLERVEKRTNESEKSSLIINISRREGVNPIYFSEKQAEILKEHQIDGIRFMYKILYEMKSGGAILAHSMGLGKTLQIISFLDISFKYNNIQTALLLCPLSMIPTWISEIEKWTAELGLEKFEVFAYISSNFKTVAKKEQFIKNWFNSERSVFIIGFETFTKILKNYLEGVKSDDTKNISDEVCKMLIKPGLIAVDEAHKIKNDKSNITKTIMLVETKHRIAITGTPLQNNLSEYWTMSNFVQPGLWDKSDFKKFFINPIMKGQMPNAKEIDIAVSKEKMYILNEEFKKITHRKDQSILKDSLPEKKEYLIYSKLTELQYKLYHKFLETFDINFIKSNYLYACNILQKIITHPDLLIDFIKRKEKKQEEDTEEKELFKIEDDLSWAKEVLNGCEVGNIENSYKIKLLMDAIDLTHKKGEKIVVFSQFTKTLDLIESYVNKIFKKNEQYFRLDGSVKLEDRGIMVDKFNNDSNSVLFMLSTKAGGLGLTLTAAARLIIMDSSWNPSDDLQATFRIYRYGQKSKTYIYRFITSDSIDEIIWDTCIHKMLLFKNVVDNVPTKLNKKSEVVLLDTKPKKIYEDNVKMEILDEDSILMGLQKLNAGVINNIMHHESLFIDDKDDISENKKKTIMEEYIMRKNTIKETKPQTTQNTLKKQTNNNNTNNNSNNNKKKNELTIDIVLKSELEMLSKMSSSLNEKKTKEDLFFDNIEKLDQKKKTSFEKNMFFNTNQRKIYPKMTKEEIEKKNKNEMAMRSLYSN